MPAATSTHINSEFVRAWIEASLQSSHDGRRNARRVPVHAHDTAERLKPAWITETRKERRCSVLAQDVFSNSRAEQSHPVREPGRHSTTVQRQIGCSGALHNVILPLKCSQSHPRRADPVICNSLSKLYLLPDRFCVK